MDVRALAVETLFLLLAMAVTWAVIWLASPAPDPFFGL